MKFIRKSGPGIIEYETEDGKIDYMYEDDFGQEMLYKGMRKAAELQEQLEECKPNGKLLMTRLD